MLTTKSNNLCPYEAVRCEVVTMAEEGVICTSNVSTSVSNSPFTEGDVYGW